MAIKSGCEWITTDHDYARFEGLRWRAPGLTILLGKRHTNRYASHIRLLPIAAWAILLHGQTIPLDSLAGTKLHHVKAEPATFNGRKALRVTDAAQAGAQAGEDRLVVLGNTNLQDGSIEIDLAGEPGPGASGQARGFVGVAFRIPPDATKFECFYLRPTNGRADDQIRRNHSAQYFSFPDFPWFRLRKEFPEKYESYVDLVPAEWTKVKIEVGGDKARLFVHGASQPSLVVTDLKHGVSPGAVGLWIGPGTVAHFADLRISPR